MIDDAREEGAKKAQAAMVRKQLDGGMSLNKIATALKVTKEELKLISEADQD